MTDIDTTDYALLACIADADGPIWKKRLHERLQARDPPLPGNTNISLQTVSRRINNMHDNGLVDTEIVQPSNISQNLIIGYQLTDEGRAVLEEKRGDLLSSYTVQTTLDDTAFTDHDTLLQLLDDELDLTAEERETLQDFDVEELLVFTLMYRARTLIDGKLDDDTAAVFADIIDCRQNHNTSSEHITNHHLS